MSRLITFGCSYTYGIGLQDCSEGSPTPSLLGWPALTSSLLDYELVNVSASGASNFEILHNILNFDFKNDDIVVIMWTHYTRDSFFRKIFSKKFPIDRLGPWSGSKDIIKNVIDTSVIIGSKWIENMNDKTFALKSWAYIYHADLLLKDKKIKYLHIPASYGELDEYKMNYPIDNICIDGFKTIDFGNDNAHPGPRSHQLIANKVYKLLNEE